MARVLVNESSLQSIANAIRGKNGLSVTYTPAQMAAAIQAINNGGLDGTVETFSQVNSVVSAYLADAAATYPNDPNYTTEVVSNYDDDAAENEKPIGKTLTLDHAGTIYFIDETDGKGWSESVSAGNYSVYNLVPGHTHRWILKDSSGAIIQGGRLLPSGALRMIYLQHPHNWRDLGGWACDGGTIKYGLLFRGAQLNHNNGVIATAADVQRLRRLGIRYEIDLRTTDQTAGQDETIETADDITYSVIGDDVYYLQFPYSEASYTEIINLSGVYGTQTRELFKLIVNNVIHGQPTYIHCQAGADRTGVVSAMVAGVLGVSQPYLDMDYELTSFYPSYQRTRLDTNWRALINSVNAIPGATLRNKFVQWFLNAGISIDDINLFRSALIDGTPTALSADDYDISYSITNNLPIGITNNNNATSAARRSSYAATITANTGDNVAIKALTVKMNGVDITESVVSLTPYSPAVNFSITNNLTNVTNSNDASTTSGGSYTATLTADSGYTLGAVTITMGGVDITATVYSSGTINISNVTGDIVITATATQTQRINQIPLSVESNGQPYNGGTGYKSGYRLGSAGTESAQSGAFVTGFIPCVKGQTISLENLELPATNYTNYNWCYIGVYDASKTKMFCNYSKDWYGIRANAATKDANNHITALTLSEALNHGDLTNMAYFRISALSIDGTSAIYVE